MAKIFENGKWKKRTLTALSLGLAATLSLGLFSACATKTEEPEEESKVAPTDTQLIKNGNFEFYSDKLVDPDDNGKPIGKSNIISSPDSWTFTSGSPTSDTKSGVIDSADWDYFTKTGGYPFKTYTKGEGSDAKEVTTFESLDEAYLHWEDSNVSAYDRLKFLDIYKTEIGALASASDQAKMFKKYSYSVDFEDVEKINEEVKLSSSGNLFELHDGATSEDKSNTSVLMIHNRRTADDGVRGTAQYYTSGTTVTLSAGTAAEISVWVRTDALYHYKDSELTQRGGAYIGVTNTVGGSTLDQMQVYNIHTGGEWRQYTFYVRASTFATSTFRVVLGLGQGSSDDKYYAVDGYAFFDDVTAKIVSGAEYDKAIREDDGEGALKTGVLERTVDSLKAEKQFDSDFYPYETYKTYALDLYAGFAAADELLSYADTALTEETSGSVTYTSEKIDPSLGDDGENFADATTLGAIKSSSAKYLKNVYENDFKDFPFGGDDTPVVMLLSANGAAYTTKLGEITLQKGDRMLLSFFVKTSEIVSGRTGASATLVDGENKTTISPFDTTTLATVDIDSKSDDDSLKDIYKGWTQCFFFVENDTDEEKSFHIELSYGPTAIVGTTKFSYGEGYAAFTNFEAKPLTKTEYGYASTGDRAKKVSLTGVTEETKSFDSVSATAEEDIKKGPALPANFHGAVGGSTFVQNGGVENVKPDSVDAGLLDSEYVKNYFASEEPWKTALNGAAGGAQNAEDWWTNLFGNARRPLVIVNREEASYGYYADSETVSASSYRRISLRVKASAGAKATVYLIDSEADTTGTALSPDLPKYTYWYDDDGDIVNMDPQSEEYKKEGKVLYELQSNGLYLKVGGDKTEYYANFENYERDDEGNCVTKDGTIAFYYDERGNSYYAYRDEDKNVGQGNLSFHTIVHELPKDICRYDYSNLATSTERAKYEAKTTVEGTGDWVTVNFYVRTGNEAKTFRLEVWSGDRDGTTNPKDSYVFFDNFSSADASSNFTTLRDEAIQAIKDELNADKNLGDEGYLGKNDNLSEENALYYTFTFFDSESYLRYDGTRDSEGLGNPYYTYAQSGYSEQPVWLARTEKDSEGRLTSSSLFFDYSAIDVTVEREYPTQDDADTDHDHDTAETDEEMNIWLLISSGSLAVVLLAVIAIVIVRRIVKKAGKRTRVKAQKDKRIRPKKTQETPKDDEE